MKLNPLIMHIAALLLIPFVAFAEPSSTQYQPNDAYNATATVASSGTTSEAIDLAGTDLVGIFVPSTFDGTTITLQASTAIDGTFVEVQDGEGSALTITTAASKFAPIPNLATIAGIRYLKLVTGTSQSTTSTVFTLALRPI